MRFLPPSTADGDENDRSRGLRRMRLLATGLLLAVTLLFAGTYAVETLFLPDRLPLALSLIRAFAEASMIGALADWFAVVALFRHPLGLPIPHTAVIPRKHARIANAIGRFVSMNLLTSTAMAQRLEELDPSGRLAAWLDRPETTTLLARRIAAALPAILETIGESRLRGAIGGALHRGIDMIITPAKMANVLSFAASQNYHQSLLDLALDAVRDFVAAHDALIRGKVAERCGEWVPVWIENRLSDAIIGGIGESLADLRDPAHPQRGEIDKSLHQYISLMADSREFLTRLEDVKTQIKADPAIEAYLEQIWTDLYGQIAGQTSTFETVIAQTLQDLSQRLRTDPGLRYAVNRWLRYALERFLVPQREFIGTVLSDLIMRWRTDSLVSKLESHVGQDLQYIRINGTIVGGVAGIAIHLIVSILSK